MAYSYKREITIDNSGGSSQSDYEILLVLDTATLIAAGKMQADGDDIHFNDNDDLTAISYWIESGINTSATRIWLKIPSLPASSYTIYLYYGDSEATAESSFENVFTVAFKQGGSGWTEVDPNSHISVSGTRIDYTELSRNEQAYIYKNIDGLINYILEFKFGFTGQVGGNGLALSGLANTLGYGESQWDDDDAFVFYIEETTDYSDYPRVYARNWNNGSISHAYFTYVPAGTNLWARIVKSDSNTVSNIFSDAWTTHISSSPKTVSSNVPDEAMTYVYPIGSYYDGNDIGMTGWVDEFRVRKYQSTEPAISVGTEQIVNGFNVSADIPIAVGISATAYWTGPIYGSVSIEPEINISAKAGAVYPSGMSIGLEFNLDIEPSSQVWHRGSASIPIEFNLEIDTSKTQLYNLAYRRFIEIYDRDTDRIVAYLKPDPDGIKDAIIDTTVNGAGTLTFKLPIESEKWGFLTDQYYIKIDDKIFIIDSDGSLETTRDYTRATDYKVRKMGLMATLTYNRIWAEMGKKYRNYISVDKGTTNAREFLTFLLEGDDYDGELEWEETGWTVGDVTMPDDVLNDIQTDKLSLLENIWEGQKALGGYIIFDDINRKVNWYDPTNYPTDCQTQVRYGKNLKSITKKTNYDIITRLYGFGYNDVSFASINDGIPYVENFSYTTRILEGKMSFDKIYDQQALMDRTILELAKICQPRNSYVISMIDTRYLPNYGSEFESFKETDLITIIDEELGIDVQQVINRIAYDVFRPWVVTTMECGDPITTLDRILGDLSDPGETALEDLADLKNTLNGLMEQAGTIGKNYPNKCPNSGFSVLKADGTLKYWDTTGERTNTSNFEGTYSLKLSPGQSAQLCTEEGGVGLPNPDWWSAWCPTTRISFRVKGAPSDVINCQVQRGESFQQLWVWMLDVTNGYYIQNTEGPDHIQQFNPSIDWGSLSGTGSLRTFAFNESIWTGAAKLKFSSPETNTSDMYIDVVIVEPDIDGHHPSFYTSGPDSECYGDDENSIYYEYGSADWNPDGVEFTLVNAYTSMPIANASIVVEVGGTGSELAGAQMQLPCLMVKETFDVDGVPTSCYSKIQVLPKGYVPVTISYGKITMQAVCSGKVVKA